MGNDWDICLKHDRPAYGETQYGPKPVHAAVPNQLAVGWRREHAWRCWSQLQSFVCWMVACEVLRRLAHKPMRSWDGGLVVAARDVDWWIYEMERAGGQ